MADGFTERFPPSITAAKLYERTSAKGNAYLTGRLGGVRVALLKTTEEDNDGHPIWEMRFSAAPAQSKSKDTSRPSTSVAGPSSQPRLSAGGFDKTLDDEIPF